MSNSRQARILSEQQVPPTCKKIDIALKQLEEIVKEQTGDLRCAFEEWIEKSLDYENEIEKLKAEIEELMNERN